ncbi:hypothetical protein VOLCADRAFT_107046 [Volvox carteri f. nagariensis]|uniref:Uncharacterized protein n=1 Tax=Volvox carteri f. nagariensis TaxID=3068 RepID=D8UBH3_VOLCA|nr:uncharacterized protein VOLCADRAFT_107046 [Volvox carteri f. nagariensis]EFJ42946.1 hypothetical protein VOLCADRAFT_107046 [Volvox carteri f. nagariensis]|eukprot:XP_002955986.1 hypothetical protein VOLCADRAFT_107046 [Volvox carteri f. nagariensis]
MLTFKSLSSRVLLGGRSKDTVCVGRSQQSLGEVSSDDISNQRIFTTTTISTSSALSTITTTIDRCDHPCCGLGRSEASAAAKRCRTVSVHAAFTPDNPVRQALSQVAINVYKVSALMSQPEAGLTPLWAAVKRLDLGAVNAALRAGADPNERDAAGDTPLLCIARAGHYKYPPNEIPAALVKAGADMEAKDKSGLTALQVSLLSGWQNIAELLIKAGASTAGVAAVKNRLTCPDCKRLVAQYNL